MPRTMADALCGPGTGSGRRGGRGSTSPDGSYETEYTWHRAHRTDLKSRDRFLVVAVTLLLIIGGRIGWQYYSWYQHAPERAMLVELETELEDAAVGVIMTQVRADSIREAIDGTDAELERGRVLLRNLESRAAAYRSDSPYMRERGAFNERVNARNRMVEEWRANVSDNHHYVDRYNLLADSMRSIAGRMGEFYYPIRSPAEIATARGVQARGG